MKFTKNQLYAGLIVDVMILLIVAAFIWPIQHVKDVKYDNQTSADLQEISNDVDSHFATNSALPQSLNEVSLDSELRNRSIERGYEYTKISFAQYELCANFRTDQSTQPDIDLPVPLGFDEPQSIIFPPDDITNTYDHREGRNCFTFSADGFFSTEPDFGGGFDAFTEPGGLPSEAEAAELLELFNVSPSDF